MSPSQILLSERPNRFVLCALGCIVGFLSGLLGIGGGIVLVPLFVSQLRFPLRLAAGTSVAAILPAALVGGLSYALQGHVDWAAGAVLIVGMILGAQLGSYLLVRLPTPLLTWCFIGFLFIAAVSLWLVVPQRDDRIEFTFLTAIALAVVGFVTGALSGAVGVGGGIVIVPSLIFFFGASDLIAKGTSLLALIPGSISGTVGNIIRKNIDLRTALYVGCSSALITPVGTIASIGVSPLWSNIAFSALIIGVLVQMALHAIRRR